jgi:hypothetical protein
VGRNRGDAGDDHVVDRLADRVAVRHLGDQRPGTAGGGRRLSPRPAPSGCWVSRGAETQSTHGQPIPVAAALGRRYILPTMPGQKTAAGDPHGASPSAIQRPVSKLIGNDVWDVR